MTDRSRTGRAGEELAARYLKERGFIITERNFSCRLGEIDIIAENGEYILFVEVKTRAERTLGRPCEAVDQKKQKRIASAAAVYLSAFECEKQPRFDVCEIIFGEKRGSCKLNYIENAFSPEELIM